MHDSTISTLYMYVTHDNNEPSVTIPVEHCWRASLVADWFMQRMELQYNNFNIHHRIAISKAVANILCYDELHQIGMLSSASSTTLGQPSRRARRAAPKGISKASGQTASQLAAFHIGDASQLAD